MFYVLERVLPITLRMLQLIAATTEFQNLNYSSAASSQNPLEVINAHKAYGYGLTGSGETIAILDAGFSTSH